MRLDQEDIQNLIKIANDSNNLDEFFSRQELQRLAEIFSQILMSYDYSADKNFNFDNWKKIVELKLQNEINEAQDYFGIKGIGNKLNISEFLNKFYYYETDQNLLKKN